MSTYRVVPGSLGVGSQGVDFSEHSAVAMDLKRKAPDVPFWVCFPNPAQLVQSDRLKGGQLLWHDAF